MASSDILEIIDEENNVVGTDTRVNIHRLGLLHREINVWFFTPDAQIVFQLRAANKDTYPNLLDATAGGHVERGFDFEATALQEMKEETGVTAFAHELHILDRFRSVNVDPITGNTNNALRAVYAYRFTEPLSQLKVESSDAVGFELWPIETLLNIGETERLRFIPSIFSEATRRHFQAIRSLLS